MTPEHEAVHRKYFRRQLVNVPEEDRELLAEARELYKKAYNNTEAKKAYDERREHFDEYRREWRKNHPEEWAAYQRRHKLMKLYGITEEEWAERYRAQDGRCAICFERGEAETLAVDHCHETNTVRGLLCRGCNTGLGSFNDNIAYLQRAIAYLTSV